MNPTTCDTAYLGGIEINHVHVVAEQVAFFYPALLLLGQLVEHLAQMLPQPAVQHLAAAFGNENYVVLALPAGVA
jgi:hypothetical protein